MAYDNNKHIIHITKGMGELPYWNKKLDQRETCRLGKKATMGIQDYPKP